MLTSHTGLTLVPRPSHYKHTNHACTSMQHTNLHLQHTNTQTYTCTYLLQLQELSICAWGHMSTWPAAAMSTLYHLLYLLGSTGRKIHLPICLTLCYVCVYVIDCSEFMRQVFHNSLIPNKHQDDSQEIYERITTLSPSFVVTD